MFHVKHCKAQHVVVFEKGTAKYCKPARLPRFGNRMCKKRYAYARYRDDGKNRLPSG